MSEAPYMKLWVGDFVGDTMHLTRAEVGQYILLLMAMWKNGGSLPRDPKKLARIARGAISDAVMAFFDTDDEGIYQKRLRAELECAQKKSIAAKQSAQTRWSDKPLKYNDTDNANALPTECCHSHSHSHSQKEASDPKGSLVNGRAVDPMNAFVPKAVENYNKAADVLGLPKAEKITPGRKTKLKARLREHGLPGWNRALQNAAEMPFCCGENDRGWRINLDWMLKPGNFDKLLERAYERPDRGN